MYNLSKFCYLCFSSERKLISINRKDSSNVSIQEKMVYCIAELINHEPDTQKFICPKCANNLNFIFKFKQIVLRNNSRLSGYIDHLRANSRSDKNDIHTTDFKETEIKTEFDSDQEQNSDEDIDLDRCVTPSSNISDNESLFENIVECDSSDKNNFTGILNLKTRKDENNSKSDEDKLEEYIKMAEEKTVRKFVRSGEKFYKCSTCEKNFRRKDTLAEHIKLHSGIKPWKCSQCDKTFARKTSLGVHEMTHSEIKPFSCDLCHKTFGQKIQLTYHYRMHSGYKPYLCSICNAGFHRNSSLITHMKTHSSIKDFECDICKKKFTLKQNLDAHVRSHLGLRPFACELCDKRFAVKCNLKDHMKIHQNIRNFECDQCDKKFVRKTDLKRHAKIHEPKTEQKIESIECDVAILSETDDERDSNQNENGAINEESIRNEIKLETNS